MFIGEHFLFPEVALGNIKLSPLEHIVSWTENGGLFFIAFCLWSLTCRPETCWCVCGWKNNSFDNLSSEFLAYEHGDCVPGDRKAPGKGSRVENLSSLGHGLFWISTHFWCVCSHMRCVLLLGREHMALRVVVELSGNEKALRLHIEMWVRVQQPGWQLCQRLEPFGFCCRGGPAPLLGLDRLVRSPEQAQSLTEPEIHPSSLLYTHSHSHPPPLHCGTLLQFGVPETWHSFLWPLFSK